MVRQHLHELDPVERRGVERPYARPPRLTPLELRDALGRRALGEVVNVAQADLLDVREEDDFHC
jgi:hypothetical protein